jgi:hypothetical protein
LEPFTEQTLDIYERSAVAGPDIERWLVEHRDG